MVAQGDSESLRAYYAVKTCGSIFFLVCLVKMKKCVSYRDRELRTNETIITPTAECA